MRQTGTVYLVDRDNMGHYNTLTIARSYSPSRGAVSGTWSSPAYFNHRIYYHGSGDVLKAFAITNALITAAPSPDPPPASVIPEPRQLSRQWNQNGIVWACKLTT